MRHIANEPHGYTTSQELRGVSIVRWRDKQALPGIAASLPLARARIRGGTHEQLYWRRGFALGYVAGYAVGIIATILALR